MPIGKWVLRTACAQNKAWQDGRLRRLRRLGERVGAPVSAGQLRADVVADVLRETGLEARYLEIELTESAVMHDADQFIAMLDGAERPRRADRAR